MRKGARVPSVAVAFLVELVADLVVAVVLFRRRRLLVGVRLLFGRGCCLLLGRLVLGLVGRGPGAGAGPRAGVLAGVRVPTAVAAAWQRREVVAVAVLELLERVAPGAVSAQVG